MGQLRSRTGPAPTLAPIDEARAGSNHTKTAESRPFRPASGAQERDHARWGQPSQIDERLVVTLGGRGRRPPVICRTAEVMPYPSARSQRCWGDNVEVQDLTVPYDVGGYLSEHLRPAQVSAVSQSGSPLLGSLWFLWVDRRFWFSSVSDSPLVRAFQNGSEVAVLVDDFSPPVDIRQVRVRGPARVERHDPARVKEIYERYLGADVDTWPGGLRNRLDDLNYIVWSVTPVSGVVASFAHFKGEEARWSNYDNCPLPEATPSPPPPAAKPLPPS